MITPSSFPYRNEPICGWPLTFRRVLERMEELEKSNEAFIINPVLGVCLCVRYRHRLIIHIEISLKTASSIYL